MNQKSVELIGNTPKETLYINHLDDKINHVGRLSLILQAGMNRNSSWIRRVLLIEQGHIVAATWHALWCPQIWSTLCSSSFSSSEKSSKSSSRNQMLCEDKRGSFLKTSLQQPTPRKCFRDSYFSTKKW